MKVDGLPYEFELELSQVVFRDPVKPGASSTGMPTGIANAETRLMVDAEAELVLVMRWKNATERNGAKDAAGKYSMPPKPPAMALVPFSNVCSMIPLDAALAPAAKK